MRINVCRQHALEAVVAALLATLLWRSESWASQLYGVVLFPDGKPAANESIQVQGGPRAITDSSGGYLLDLPPGKYSLQVKNKKFEVEVLPQDTRNDLHLQ